jgi:hypothetical protein
MANPQVNQEAQRISDCCNKMQNMNDEQERTTARSTENQRLLFQN